MTTRRMSPALLGLAQATSTDPYDTSRMALDARARQRMSEEAQAEEERLAEGPAFSGYMLDLGRGDRNRRLLGLSDPMSSNSGWDAWFESIREAGERQGKQAGFDLGESGLPDAPAPSGTLPLSLQGLKGVQYGYQGERPVAARFRR